MTRIKSLDELKVFKNELKDARCKSGKCVELIIGMATCGIAAGAKEVHDAIEQEIKTLGIEKTVSIVKSGCIGTCYAEPTVEVKKDGKSVLYGNVDANKAVEIVKKHLQNGEIVKENVIEKPFDEDSYNSKSKKKAKQFRIALRNCGVIDPESIDDYILKRGYETLGNVLSKMSSQELIDLIKKSGLRGRGGGGFPTGLKWELAAKQPGTVKYVICNADEGDPGAFMDRSILEGDPHSILEAMTMAGYAIGSNFGYIYIRAEYPLAVKRLRIAIKQAKEMGLLGKNIFDTNFDFDIEIRYGAGAFVCGEETSLINSVEGNRGEPRNKPPFPAEAGLWGKPTIVNNVETFANIPPIGLHGSEWFTSIGTEKSSGTKVFALAGKVNNVGLVEIPMGTSLREIIFEAGGGIKDSKQIKAVQTGGPSGGCIPRELLDTKIDYDNLAKIGSMMGSGGMIVMDEDDCMVNLTKFYLEFTMDESCGKCTACRVGNKRLHEILSKITTGRGTVKDLEILQELGEIIKDTSLCGLGQSSPNPVLSTLRYFYDEYKTHVEDKMCPSYSCKELVSYRILEDKCIGCGVCKKVCPVECISGKIKELHVIDQEKCIKCGACFKKCKFDAIKR